MRFHWTIVVYYACYFVSSLADNVKSINCYSCENAKSHERCNKKIVECGLNQSCLTEIRGNSITKSCKETEPCKQHATSLNNNGTWSCCHSDLCNYEVKSVGHEKNDLPPHVILICRPENGPGSMCEYGCDPGYRLSTISIKFEKSAMKWNAAFIPNCEESESPSSTSVTDTTTSITTPAFTSPTSTSTESGTNIAFPNVATSTARKSDNFSSGSLVDTSSSTAAFTLTLSSTGIDVTYPEGSAAGMQSATSSEGSDEPSEIIDSSSSTSWYIVVIILAAILLLILLGVVIIWIFYTRRHKNDKYDLEERRRYPDSEFQRDCGIANHVCDIEDEERHAV